MSLKNKLVNLRTTPSPQIIVTDNNEPEANLHHQASSSSLARFFNRSRGSSSTSLHKMISNESKKIDSLQYNKGSLLSPKLSQSSSNSASSQKSKHFIFQRNASHNNSINDQDEKTTSPAGSKLELKRFFKNVIKPGTAKKEHHGISQLKDNLQAHHKKHHHGHHKSTSPKPASPVNPYQQQAAAAQALQEKMLFGAETSQELIRKYGVPGKILGEGAGGSVAIVQRPSDDRIFAVKQFRPKNAKESDYDYTKKVQSEFFVGSTLHHQNIIETIDMLQEGLKFLIVMEYCPYDFFTIVMSGLLQKNEISCYFKQIVNGVNYLHSMGLAHRDLKLDNCVVTSDGILKLIDFGSAIVFKYPFEDDLIKAKGVVGSDPYLAPEVLQIQNYDPRPVDVWSIAIIFCCMTLKRFPWKVPKVSDPSYRAFTQVPPATTNNSPNDSETTIDVQIQKAANHELSVKEAHELQAMTNMISNSTTTAFAPRSKTKGPYRLLRLLPHSSRPLIGAMLALDPKKRISIEGVLYDEWFTSIQECTMDDGTLFKAENHRHHLVTEEELNKLQAEKEQAKKIKDEVAA